MHKGTESSKEPGGKLIIDKVSIAISLLLLATLVFFTLTSPQSTTDGLVSAKDFVTKYLGSYFVVLIIGMLVYNCWLVFSKYGNIRLGKERPLYKTFGWFAMIFFASMGATILFWSSVEWMYYVQTPPFGYEPFSQEAYDISLAYSLFHWGIPPWSVYACGVIPLAYRYFVRKKEGLSMQDVCEGVLGEKRAHGSLGKVITIFFIFGIVGGLTLSYGASVPMLTNNLHNLFGTPESFFVEVLFVLALTALFCWSASSGISTGILNLSKFCAYLSIALITCFFVFGNPLFAIENTIQALGTMVYKFFPMLTYMDPIGKSGFPQDWTVFYWAWWLGLAPVNWIFFAKISSGRSIRQVVLCIILAGSLGSILYFGTVSNYGIAQQLFGGFDLVKTMSTVSTNEAISQMMLSMPIGKLVIGLWIVTSFILVVTTLDSAAYTLATATVPNIGTWDDPPLALRIFWSAMLAVIPLCLFYADAGLNGFQSVLIISSIPVSICIIMALISCTKWLLQDYGDKSAEEIKKEYALEKLPKVKKERKWFGKSKNNQTPKEA